MSVRGSFSRKPYSYFEVLGLCTCHDMGAAEVRGPGGFVAADVAVYPHHVSSQPGSTSSGPLLQCLGNRLLCHLRRKLPFNHLNKW